MSEISQLIARAAAERTARSEKQSAFGEIVQRFQDLAFGCAFSVLGDFHLAEDAAQEAFLERVAQSGSIAHAGSLSWLVQAHCAYPVQPHDAWQTAGYGLAGGHSGFARTRL